MKTRFLNILLFFLFTSSFYSQDKEFELIELKKIDKILDSASNFTSSNPELSIKLAIELKPSLLNNNRVDRLGFCYRVLGSANFYLGKYEISKENYSLSLNIAIQKKDTINIILGYSGIGLGYLEQKEYEKVDEIYKKTLGIAEDFKNVDQIIRIKEVLGINSFYQHDFVTAINYYNDALDVAAKAKDSSHFSRIYINLGNVYVKAGELDLARGVLIKGKNIVEKENNSYYKAHYYSGLGELYRLQKLNKLSVEYHKMAVDTFAASQNIAGVASSSIYLAIIFEEEKELEKSKLHLDIAYLNAKKIDDVEILAYYHILKAKISLEEMSYTKALLYVDSAFGFSNKINELSIRKDIFEIQSEIFEGQKEFEKALISYKEFNRLEDSLTRIENSSKIKEIGLRKNLEFLEKEKEIQSQKLILSQQREKDIKVRFYLIVLTSILFLVLLLSFYFFRTSKLKKEKEIALQNESLEKLNAELVILKLKKTEKAKEFLETEVNEKNNKIKSLVHSINQKNEWLDELTEDPLLKEKNVLLKKLKRIIDSEEERAFFNEEIDQMNTNFYQNLKSNFPNLSDNDLKLSSMLKMGLSSKEMATLLSISSSSVDVARSRLRKKLGVSKDDNLIDFINSI